MTTATAAAPLIAPSTPRAAAQRLAYALLQPRRWTRVKLAGDLLVLYMACVLALVADARIRAVSTNVVLAAGFPVLVVALSRLRGASEERLGGSLLEACTHALGVVSLATMLLLAADSVLHGPDPVGLAIRLWLFSLVYLSGLRAMLISIRHEAMRLPAFSAPTLIVGAGMIGSHLVQRLVQEPRYGLRPVGFLDSDPLPDLRRTTGMPPLLGGPEDLEAAITQTGARHVILAFSTEPDHVLVSKVRECGKLGVTVSLVPRLYETINERARLDHIGGLPLLTLRSVDPRGWQFALKHALDRTVAAIALLLLSPLLLAIAVAVRLSSPGPIFFRQQRVGRDGHEFTMLKFRTMRGDPSAAGEADAEWAAAILDQVASTDSSAGPPVEDRTTRVGRILRDYSLDELPQLINVLRGDMSLVGPRPERVSYVRNFEQYVARYADRHRVKSGITGWAQVNGLRGETSITDRVEWDNFYIQNWSLRLDVRIVLLTLAEVLRSRDSANSRPGSRARA